MTADDIWPIVKGRLGLTSDEHKEMIGTYIDEIGYRIKHYCNISSIPEALKFVWASMVIDVLKSEHSNIKEIGKTIDRGKNIKIGDTSISPTNSGSTKQKSAIDAVVLNYAVDLNRYRRLTW